MPASTITSHSAIAEVIDRIDVHKDRLSILLRSQENPGAIYLADNNEPTDDRCLFIPSQKPPSKRFREILLPHGSSRGPARATGTTSPPRQSHRKRQTLAGRDDLRIHH